MICLYNGKWTSIKLYILGCFFSSHFYSIKTQNIKFESVERVYFALNNQGICTRQNTIYNRIGNKFCQTNINSIPVTSSYWQCEEDGTPIYYNCLSQNCTPSTCISQNLSNFNPNEACQSNGTPMTSCSMTIPPQSSQVVDHNDSILQIQNASATNLIISKANSGSDQSSSLHKISQPHTIKISASHPNLQNFSNNTIFNETIKKSSPLLVDIVIHRKSGHQMALISYTNSSMPKDHLLNKSRTLLSAKPVQFNLSNSISKFLKKNGTNNVDTSNGPIKIASEPSSDSSTNSGNFLWG